MLGRLGVRESHQMGEANDLAFFVGQTVDGPSHLECFPDPLDAVGYVDIVCLIVNHLTVATLAQEVYGRVACYRVDPRAKVTSGVERFGVPPCFDECLLGGVSGKPGVSEDAESHREHRPTELAV